MDVWERARDAISRLFPAFFDDPSLMPAEWAALAASAAGAERATVVADYIAGMTDRYALDEVIGGCLETAAGRTEPTTRRRSFFERLRTR